MRYIGIGIVGIALVSATFTACGSAEEPAVQRAPLAEPVEPNIPTEAPEKVVFEPKVRMEAASPPRNVWAPGKEGVLIAGLDGGLYDAYSPGVIVEVQKALSARGNYTGEAHGYLDETTMVALGAFQKEQELQVCGVPTPRTRRVLFGVTPER